MDFQLKTSSLAAAAKERTGALIVLAGEAALTDGDALSKLVGQARTAGDLSGEAGQCLSLYRSTVCTARHLVLASTGDGAARAVGNAVRAALTALGKADVTQLTLAFAQAPDAAVLQAAVLACADASYAYTTSVGKPKPRKLQRIVLAAANASSLGAALTHAQAAVAGIELAKEWANRPGNYCTPRQLANAAKALAKEHASVRCEVFGPAQVAKLGMGAFGAVAQGSAEPLRFIVLRYDGGAKGSAPVVLVGKGITFDTGGVSLKPAAEMDEMKFDMGGAASVLGTFRALAHLRPSINVVGLIPSCENMNDGKAVKPGDVVTSMDKQTIEVLNTDAEGRLILCDALGYAKRFKPAAVIDIATLTGACVIALGHVRSGLFSADDALADALLAAGEEAQDLCWRMPLDDEYAEGLKSRFADVANIAGRPAGSITAAKFLQRFVGEMPWAHLDIAGTAWKSGKAKGATGRPVGLLLGYLAHRAQQSTATPAVAKPRAGGNKRSPQ